KYKDRKIEVEIELSPTEAVVTVGDQGSGFDPTSLPDPTDPENLEKISGRGVLLMRSFMDVVEFNAQGNQVKMIKRRKA
ncbi:MAG: ATP-binding protein, partial [Pirellulales bacterium]|nr:ATP-binding protein [Pirellulales bacterium]